jgi:PKD repeat protein
MILFPLILQNSLALADINVRSLVKDGQGILPKSGPVEIFGINAFPTFKITADLSDPAAGFVRSVSVSYDTDDPNEIWLIQCIGVETVLDGVAGTYRFAVARSQKTDHPSYPILEPISNESVWQRQPNPACATSTPPESCSIWPYLDARVGPASGQGSEYVWNFKVAGTNNSGTIRLTLFLCGGSSGSTFQYGDRFIIDMADKDVTSLTSLKMIISNVPDTEDQPDYDVTPDDFDAFKLYADSGGDRNGIFDPAIDYEIPSSWYVSADGGDWFEITVAVLGSAPVPPNNSGAYMGDDYFIVLETSDTIDSACCSCPKDNPIDDFTCILEPGAFVLDDGGYLAPLICNALETGKITCESLAVDLLPKPQAPPYLCSDLLDVHYPGNLTDLPNGKQRYQYFVPDVTIRPKYSAEYSLLSGITESAFDVIYKSPDDPSVDIPSYFEIPEVTPLERRFGVIGLDVAGGTTDNPEYLNVLTVTLSNTFDDFEFDPRDYLDDIRPTYPYFSGLAIYADTNRNGVWDEVSYDPVTFLPKYGTGDLPMDIFWTSFETEDFITYRIQLWLDNPLPIDLLADRKPDYFIVERTDSGLTDDSPFSRDGKGISQGANFITGLESVSFRRAFPDLGLKTNAVKTSFSALSAQDYNMFFGFDLNGVHSIIQQTIDAQSAPTPILAFNAACSDVPQTGLDDDPIRFQSIKIKFDGEGTGFGPEDIDAIYIYRDDKSPYFDFPPRNIGVFDSINDMANWMPPESPLDAPTNPVEESPIPLNDYEITTDGFGNYQVILAPRIGMPFYPRDKIESEASIDVFGDNFRLNEARLPENIVFPGSDYFVCIATSDKIAYRDIIRPIIPIGGVISSTGPTVLKTQDFVHPEDKEGVVSEILANVPVFLEDLVRTRRGLNPSLGADETDVELIGINAFTNHPVNGEEVFLEQLIVQFIEAASRLSPNFNLGENGDIIHYQDYNGPEAVNSGIKVWRQIGGERYLVMFAETDHNTNTFLDNSSLVASSDAENQAILLVFNPDDTSSLVPGGPSVRDLLRIPETDDGLYAGNDFIITISTSSNFDVRQDNFSASIISWGPDSPGAPKPYQVLNGTMPPEYPPIPPAFSFASSSALLYYQNYPEATRGIGFIDSNGVHSRSFKTINTCAFNASAATRLKAVGNFTATLADPQVTDRTRQVVLTWADSNSTGPGTYNESGYWIESDMFGSDRPLPQDPLPSDTRRLFFNGPRFLAGRTVNFRIYAFQEGLNPGAKFPPMNGIGPVAETSITFDLSIMPIPPTADFSASPTSGCAPVEVCFTDKSLDGPTSWLWDFGDGATSTQQNPCHIYTESGNYTVSLTVSNNGGPDTLSRPDFVQIDSIPVPTFEANITTICAGGVVSFTDASSGNPSWWVWDFGDGSPMSSEQHPIHTFETPGTYDVTLTAGNDCGSDSATRAALITVSEGVIANFSSDTTQACVPLTVHFINESLCEPTGYLWDFGDGSTSAEVSPVHLYSTSGTFTVSLTATRGGTSDTETKTDYITVNPLIADFVISITQGCAPLSVQFTDRSSCNPTSWLWDFGDGTPTSNQQNPAHVYDAAGVFDVTLTVSTANSSDSLTIPAAVTVTKRPVAAFSSDSTTICSGDAVQFTDESSNEPTAWLWDFGDGTVSTEQNPSHTYSSVGIFTVSLSAINACGTDIITKSNYIGVDEAPVPAFSAASVEGCAPFMVQFTDQSTKHPTSWEWDFGDASPVSTEQNPIHVYSSGGTYDVTLTVTNACTSESLTRTGYISVSEGITAAFTSDVTEGCPPTTIRFENRSLCSPTAFLWDFGDGSTSTDFSPSHVYATAGTFTVSLTATKGEASSIETKTDYITVNPLVADFDVGAAAGCAPLSVQFTDRSLCNPTSWLWDFGDGTPPSNLQNPVHIYDACGTFDVTLTITTSTATDTITKTGAVTAGKKPAAEFSADGTSVCVGDTIGFTDGSSCEPTAWLWNFGDGAISVERNPSHTYSAAGAFTVSLTATNSCGTSTVTKTSYITVRALSIPDFSASVTAGCVPLTVQFTDLSINAPASWEWDFGDGSAPSTLQNPAHTYIDVGAYTVSLTVRNDCGEATEIKSEFIVVREVVTAEFEVGRLTVCSGESIEFIDLSTGDATTWEWNFGDGSPKSIEPNPFHVFAATGNYLVTFTVSNGCSTSGISHELAVEIFTEPRPDFTFSSQGQCAPLDFCFVNTSSGKFTDQLWEFGDGTSSSDVTPPCHTYTEPGTYRVCLSIANPCGVFTQCKDIIVYGEPRADFITDLAVGEVPLTVCFTDDSVGGNIISRRWQFGDGASSAEKNPCHTYVKAGKYTVSLTVISACGTDTLTVPDAIEVYDTIRLLAPANGAYVQEPPTFRWSGSVNNQFRAEYSYDPTFARVLASTPILTRSSFTVPLPVWEGVPTYKKIYWRVRGANSDVTPLEIHMSEVWTFWKY